MPPRPISPPPEEVGSAEVSMDETIHHTKLQAMVRQLLKDGLPIPLETLGITVLDGVKLTKRFAPTS